MRLNIAQSNSCGSGRARFAWGKRLAQARRGLAFTLTEMLVVISIIAIITTISIPAIKGLTESNAVVTASRQLLDDVAYARQKAISDRTTVYMVFLPPEFWGGFNSTAFSALGDDSRKQIRTLYNGQYTTYALYVERSLGDQPGRHYTNYITDWRSLPEGMLIDTNKFNINTTNNIADPYDDTSSFDVASFPRRMFPFPPAELTNNVPRRFSLPYIAFNSQGGLLSSVFTEDEFLPLAKGSVFYLTNSAGDPLPPDVVETGYREATRTNYNLIRIDSLTGRAKLEKMELQ